MTRMRACQHCNEGFEVAATGRPPKYCSSKCRKAAWEAERFRQAVVVEVAKRLAAERRRENRRNETPGSSGIRRNETPPQATPPNPARRRSGMTASAMPLWTDRGEPGGEGRPSRA
ncbi:hypothetical protein SALBM217S_02341 [Streptomyces griseoloalbus]|uniref:Uncharacterized protein n=1 Tax=Streptomyces pseudogriseolus TaxID=36817 RepID=A0ABQ2TP66_STREZ|nr:hypothetical protein GCM10010285_65500 [Streptomyces rubiginosus]